MTDDLLTGWVVIMPDGEFMVGSDGEVVEFTVEDDASAAAVAVGGIVAPLLDDEGISAAGGEA